MALSSYSSLLHSLLPLLLLILAPLPHTTSTLMNPTLLQEINCFPPAPAPAATNLPKAIDCIAAMLTLPFSQPNIDFHTVNGHVVYDTALTSTVDPNSRYSLPRTPHVGSCQVVVGMAEGVHLARVLWMDVQQYTMALIHRCVGDERAPGVAGPGSGGWTSVGSVIISVRFAGPSPGDVLAFAAQRAGLGGGSNGRPDDRIGAHYPPPPGSAT